MAERRVAEIVAERDRLGEIVVEPERLGERARDLRDLDRMGEAGAEMIALVVDEDLGLVREAAKGGRMDDAVAVALEIAAGRRGRLGVEAPARAGGIGGVGRASRSMPRPSSIASRIALRPHSPILISGRRRGLDAGMDRMSEIAAAAEPRRRVDQRQRRAPLDARFSPARPARRCAFRSRAAAARAFNTPSTSRRSRAEDDLVVDARRREGRRRSRLARNDEGLGARFRRRSDGPVVQGQEPQRRRLLRLRRELFRLSARRNRQRQSAKGRLAFNEREL